MNSPVIHRTVSLAASVLVSLAVFQLIATHAIPSDSPQMLVLAETATAMPAPAPGTAR
jgi:hypothetical protein